MWSLRGHTSPSRVTACCDRTLGVDFTPSRAVTGSRTSHMQPEDHARTSPCSLASSGLARLTLPLSHPALCSSKEPSPLPASGPLHQRSGRPRASSSGLSTAGSPCFGSSRLPASLAAVPPESHPITTVYFGLFCFLAQLLSPNCLVPGFVGEPEGHQVLGTHLPNDLTWWTISHRWVLPPQPFPPIRFPKGRAGAAPGCGPAVLLEPRGLRGRPGVGAALGRRTWGTRCPQEATFRPSGSVGHPCTCGLPGSCTHG